MDSEQTKEDNQLEETITKLPQLLRDRGDDELERLIHESVNSSKSRGVSYEIEDRLRQMTRKWQPKRVAMSTQEEMQAGEDGRHVTREGIGCTCLVQKKMDGHELNETCGNGKGKGNEGKGEHGGKGEEGGKGEQQHMRMAKSEFE